MDDHVARVFNLSEGRILYFLPGRVPVISIREGVNPPVMFAVTSSSRIDDMADGLARDIHSKALHELEKFQAEYINRHGASSGENTMRLGETIRFEFDQLTGESRQRKIKEGEQEEGDDDQGKCKPL